jgi:glyoxylate reductase
LGLFGCEIYYYNRTRANPEIEQALGVKYLTLRSFYVPVMSSACIVPAAPNTIDLISTRRICHDEPGDPARQHRPGEVVNIQALVEALTEGQIFGVAMDTTMPKPPPADYPCRTCPPMPGSV